MFQVPQNQKPVNLEKTVINPVKPAYQDFEKKSGFCQPWIDLVDW